MHCCCMLPHSGIALRVVTGNPPRGRTSRATLGQHFVWKQEPKIRICIDSWAPVSDIADWMGPGEEKVVISGTGSLR